MIIPDINLLLYATFSSMPQHARARKWWLAALETEEVGMAVPVVFGFIRIATNRKAFEPPLTVEKAASVVFGWLEAENARLLTPGPRHLEIAIQLLKDAGSGGNLTTDAQIAALAIEYQATLCSNDTDFSRFAGLRWVNPLQASTK